VRREWNNQDEHNPCRVATSPPSSRDRSYDVCECVRETRIRAVLLCLAPDHVHSRCIAINSTGAHESLAESDSTECQVLVSDDKVASRNARARPTDLPKAASFLSMCEAVSRGLL